MKYYTYQPPKLFTSDCNDYKSAYTSCMKDTINIDNLMKAINLIDKNWDMTTSDMISLMRKFRNIFELATGFTQKPVSDYNDYIIKININIDSGRTHLIFEDLIYQYIKKDGVNTEGEENLIEQLKIYQQMVVDGKILKRAIKDKYVIKK